MSCSVTWRVEASGPKNRARMSFSKPSTSKPADTKCRTLSEPISPPDPVTIATGIAMLGPGPADRRTRPVPEPAPQGDAHLCEAYPIGCGVIQHITILSHQDTW